MDLAAVANAAPLPISATKITTSERAITACPNLPSTHRDVAPRSDGDVAAKTSSPQLAAHEHVHYRRRKEQLNPQGF
jgi:hypothetical protein